MRSVRRSLGWSLALLVLGSLPAVAVEVNVANCSDETLDVKSYNQDDTLRWVPYETKSVAGKSMQTITCNGITSCQLNVAYGSLAADIPQASWRVNVIKLNPASGPMIFTPSECY